MIGSEIFVVNGIVLGMMVVVSVSQVCLGLVSVLCGKIVSVIKVIGRVGCPFRIFHWT